MNLNECNNVCKECIVQYKQKHRLTKKEKKPFRISCNGIPSEYIDKDLCAVLPEEDIKTALTMVDPVAWAAEVLDWHCLDPDGEIWKRRNPAEYEDWVRKHPGEDVFGHSRYHRPYQASMLRCSARRKVFRIGRQAGKTEILVIAMLFHLFTKPDVPENEGFKIVVIAPYQSQINLIFNRIDELLSVSSLAINSIASRTKSPPRTIILYNKSTLIGFTAGTKSGGNADSVRGQKANMLVLDEADYLNSGDLDSALAIITNFPNASVWMSSTPKGTRDTFYNTCFSRAYREFHYPAYVNPLWSDELEATFREQYTEITYKHEALAEFGEQEEGVFQNTYIQKAKSPYSYGDKKYDPNWVYTMGVDWNDTAIGTSIVVVGRSPINGHFYIVDKRTVSREGWQQLAACEKIVEMNQFWRPAFIYIDEGYGSTNFEIIRKFGYDSIRDKDKGIDHPDSKLQKIVKGYQFGGKIEIHDLITKQPINKPAKPFLVENTVRRFETGTIHFSENDDLLEKQLLGYIVDHVTSAGSPVYKATDSKVGDHDLDALMLALVAFTLEKTDFGKPVHNIDFTFAGRFGEKTMPDLDGIGIIIKNDKKQDPREKNKPALCRTENVSGEEKTVLAQKTLPAAHTNMETGVKLWSWPGFGSDAPKPKIRSIGEKKRSRTSKPSRKNI